MPTKTHNKHVIASQGMLKDVNKCSTAAFLHTHGYHPIEQEDQQFRLIAGIAIHEGLHRWIRGCSIDECMTAVIDGYRPYSDKYMELSHAYHCDNIERIMGRWFEQNRYEDMPFTYVNAEYPTRAKLADHEVSDISDAIVADKIDGTLMAFESKSTGNKVESASFAMEKRCDPQFRQHVYVCRANGFNVKGVILNAIQINKLPEALTRKCKDHHISQVLCWVQHVHFIRLPLIYSPDEMLDWMKSAGDALDTYKHTIYDLWTAKLVPMSELFKIRQEGIAGDRCSRCQYKDFCQSGRKNMTLLASESTPREGIIRSGVVDNNG